MKIRYRFLPVFSIVCSFLTGCINDEYDLNKLQHNDYQVLDNAVAPLGCTKRLYLPEMLTELEIHDVLSIDDAGNYYVNVHSGNLFKSITVPEFHFAGYDEENPHETTLKSPLVIPSLDPGHVTPSITFDDIVFDIELEQNDLPEMITYISQADVSSSLTIKFQYDKSSLPADKVWFTKGLRVLFPEWIVLGDVPEGFIKEDVHTITATEDFYIEPDNSSLSVGLDALDFTRLPEGQGFIGTGKLHIDAEVVISGNIYMRTDDCIQAGTYTPVITAFLHMDRMDVDYALAEVDLASESAVRMDIPLGTLGSLLDHDQYTLDIHDLRMNVALTSSIPADVSLSTSLQAFDGNAEDPVWSAPQLMFALPEGSWAAPSESFYSFSESGQGAPTGYQNVAVEGLDDIFADAPDVVSVGITAELPEGEYIRLVPGDEFAVEAGYTMSLSPFGPGFSISSSQLIEGLDVSLTDITLHKALLKFNLVNTIPLGFELGAAALDEAGDVIPHIEVKLDSKVAGGTLDSPSVSPVVLTLTSDGPLEFSSILVNIYTEASSANVVLNKEQYIQLTDISITLPEGAGFTI